MIYFCLAAAAIGLSLPAAAQEAPPASRELVETIQQLQRQLTQQQGELRELRQALPPKAASPAASPARTPARVGFFINVEPQWIVVLGLEREFAARNNTAVCPGGGGGACLSATGSWATVDARDIFAPKVTAGFVSPDGDDVFSIGGFHAESSGGTARFNPPGNVIGAAPLNIFDEITNVNGQPLPRSADAVNSFAMDQLDFDYERVMPFGGLELTPELGVRSLFFKNELKTAFNHALPGFNFNLTRASRSMGVGPKAGLAADWRLRGPVSVRAKGGIGYLIGYNESEQSLCQGASFANPGCGIMHSFRSRTGQGFPFIEGEFALQYKARRARGLSAAAGYRLASYLGLVTLPETVGGSLASLGDSSVQRDIFQRHDVTISSIFFRLQYLF